MRVAPSRPDTFGDIAATFAADYGLDPDPWQRLVLDDWLGTDGDRWSSLTCGLSVPRQNGKNALLEVRELFGMVGRGERILHTAHEVKTARKAFKRLQHFFGSRPEDPAAKYPELNALVSEVRNVNGQEAVVLKNGGSVEIVARSKSSARGFTVDVLVMDEAQELSDEDLEALMPTTSSAPLGNPQWLFTGTPPGPKVNGEVFSRIRAEALDGKSGRLVWHEWSAEPGADLDDPDEWLAANPALGIRLQAEVVEGERARFSDSGFARERLGMWAVADAAERVLPGPSWTERADGESVAVDRFALGVEVGPDLAWASVALAGQRPDGDWHIELDADQHTKGRGVAWLPRYVQALVAANPQVRAVVVDVAGPIAALLEQRAGRWWFKGTKLQVTPVKVAELGAGCSRVLDGIVTGWLRHIGQPQLTTAALSAGKRALGDTGMWVWSRKSADSDVTPIQAATLALIGAQNANVKKPGSAEPRRVVVLT